MVNDIIFVPSSVEEFKGQLKNGVVLGTLAEKLKIILDSDQPVDSVFLVGVIDSEYLMFKELLPMLDIKYRILVGIPDIESPSSFLYEEDKEIVISYFTLMNTEAKKENKEDKMLSKLDELREKAKLSDQSDSLSSDSMYSGEDSVDV